MTPSEARLLLHSAGFAPLPLFGKRPVFDGWRRHTETNPDEIRLRSQL